MSEASVRRRGRCERVAHHLFSRHRLYCSDEDVATIHLGSVIEILDPSPRRYPACTGRRTNSRGCVMARVPRVPFAVEVCGRTVGKLKGPALVRSEEILQRVSLTVVGVPREQPSRTSGRELWARFVFRRNRLCSGEELTQRGHWSCNSRDYQIDGCGSYVDNRHQ